MTRSRLAALAVATAALAARSAAASSLDDPCALAAADRVQATSRDCLTCHDGTVASARPISGGPGAHHPVDLDYDRAALANPRLVQRFQVSRSLALPGGRLSCVTCHDGASREPMHTALPMDRSRMCTACHAV